MNTLYNGDNLRILRDYIKDASVDLVYYPKLQIMTIEGLLSGKQVDMPPSSITFKQAENYQNQPIKEGSGMNSKNLNDD